MTRTWLLALAMLAGACGTATAPPVPTEEAATATAAGTSASVMPTATASSASTLRVNAVRLAYGSVQVRTEPDASCSAVIRTTRSPFGEAPPSLLPTTTAGRDGIAAWTYPSPRIPKGSGLIDVRCTLGAAVGTLSERFDIPDRRILPAGFTVRLTSEKAPQLNVAEDPALSGLRDAALTHMRGRLADDWRVATRGLGPVRIVDESADITIFVVAAAGVSVNRHGPDGSMDIVLYVQDADPRFGRLALDNINATGLHELGHIWCCYGTGTYPGEDDRRGHWLTDERDPRLYGADKYGLMISPVTCDRFGAVLSCPNRFSDREMVQLGFKDFPPPIPDACVTQSLAFQSQLNDQRSQLTSLGTELDSLKNTLTSLDQEITTIERLYPVSAPSSVVAQYRALVSEYNATADTYDLRVASYNAVAAAARATTSRLSALPCDP